MAKKQTRATKTKNSETLVTPEKSIELHQHSNQEHLKHSACDSVNSDSEIRMPNSLIAAFWGMFRLSPGQQEHTVITNMGWLTVITLAPLCLSALLGIIYDIIYYQQGFMTQYLSSNLGDRIFTTITLSLFFGALIFSLRWYPTLQWAFQSLRQNDVLRDKKGERLTEAEFLGFLEDYQRNLHSRKRYILVVIFMLFILG